MSRINSGSPVSTQSSRTSSSVGGSSSDPVRHEVDTFQSLLKEKSDAKSSYSGTGQGETGESDKEGGAQGGQVNGASEGEILETETEQQSELVSEEEAIKDKVEVDEIDKEESIEVQTTENLEAQQEEAEALHENALEDKPEVSEDADLDNIKQNDESSTDREHAGGNDKHDPNKKKSQSERVEDVKYQSDVHHDAHGISEDSESMTFESTFDGDEGGEELDDLIFGENANEAESDTGGPISDSEILEIESENEVEAVSEEEAIEKEVEVDEIDKDESIEVQTIENLEAQQEEAEAFNENALEDKAEVSEDLDLDNIKQKDGSTTDFEHSGGSEKHDPNKKKSQSERVEDLKFQSEVHYESQKTAFDAEPMSLMSPLPDESAAEGGLEEEGLDDLIFGDSDSSSDRGDGEDGGNGDDGRDRVSDSEIQDLETEAEVEVIAPEEEAVEEKVEAVSNEESVADQTVESLEDQQEQQEHAEDHQESGLENNDSKDDVDLDNIRRDDEPTTELDRESSRDKHDPNKRKSQSERVEQIKLQSELHYQSLKSTAGVSEAKKPSVPVGTPVVGAQVDGLLELNIEPDKPMPKKPVDSLMGYASQSVETESLAKPMGNGLPLGDDLKKGSASLQSDIEFDVFGNKGNKGASQSYEAMEPDLRFAGPSSFDNKPNVDLKSKGARLDVSLYDMSKQEGVPNNALKEGNNHSQTASPVTRSLADEITSSPFESSEPKLGSFENEFFAQDTQPNQFENPFDQSLPPGPPAEGLDVVLPMEAKAADAGLLKSDEPLSTQHPKFQEYYSNLVRKMVSNIYISNPGSVAGPDVMMSLSDKDFPDTTLKFSIVNGTLQVTIWTPPAIFQQMKEAKQKLMARLEKQMKGSPFTVELKQSRGNRSYG